MKKYIRYVLYSLSVLSTLLISPEAKAKIPSIAFFNVTSYFKHGAEPYSPIHGDILLDAGYIFDERLFGDYEKGMEGEKRQYIKDKSSDPHWILTKNLFPSPAGHLTIETSAKYNFGNLVKTPQTIAFLLNYAKDIRRGKVYSGEDNAHLKKSILESFNQEFKKDEAGNIVKQTIEPILDSIRDSIKAEKGKLGHAYLTEHLINAFFCEKFFTRDDIGLLLDNLDSDIVDKDRMRTFANDDILTEETLNIIAKKDRYGIDDTYALGNGYVFYSVTPYKPGGTLPCEGNTFPYNRDTDEFNEGKTFTNCVEQSLNILLNLIMNDPISRTFNLNSIRTYVDENSPNNPYFKNFEAFYEHQSPGLANKSDLRVRSLFNKVVGDLNGASKNPVRYKQKGKNEIRSGFINIINAFQTIFGLKIPELPQGNFNLMKEWLEESFSTLFNALNPNNVYRFALSGLEQIEEEISGTLSIKVSDKKTNGALYSLDLNSKYNAHTYIDNLVILKKGEGLDFEQLLSNKSVLDVDAAGEPLFLLTPRSVQFEMITNPLLQLFNRQLSDNESKIEKLKLFNSKYRSWKRNILSSEPQKAAINTILGHILDDISWDDLHVVRRITPLITDLYEKDEFTQTILTRVRGLSCYNEDQTMINTLLDGFKKTEHLSLKGTKERIVTFRNVSPLKTLFLEHMNISQLELDNLPIFEMLKLAGINKIDAIVLKNLKKLHTLEIDSLDSKMISFENLDGIEDLNLNNLTNLQKVVFSGTFKKLRKITFNENQKVDIEGLDELLATKEKPIKIIGRSKTITGTHPLDTDDN